MSTPVLVMSGQIYPVETPCDGESGWHPATVTLTAYPLCPWCSLLPSALTNLAKKLFVACVALINKLLLQCKPLEQNDEALLSPHAETLMLV